MDWNAVADGLVTAAKTTGVNALEFVPDALPNVPSFYVGEIDVELDITFRRSNAVDGRRRGNDQATITCRILVAKASDKHALKKLRDFMSGGGPESIVQAIQNAPTLGGSVDASHVKRMRGNRLFLVGEKRFYGVELDVFVIGPA